MTAQAKTKPIEVAARAMHEWARETEPEQDLPGWDDVPAAVRERYVSLAKTAVKAWKKAKA